MEGPGAAYRCYAFPVVLGSDDIVHVAHAASSPREMFTQLIGCLRDHFESDVSMLHVGAAYPVTRCGPVASLGFDAQRMRALAGRWPAYVQELDALKCYAEHHGPVVREADVFSCSTRQKKAYYRELSAPEGGLDSLVAYLPWRGCSTAAVMLGSRSRCYSSAAHAELGKLVPALSLVVAAAPTAARRYPPNVHLTSREQQVAQYVEAGLTNSQIAQCLGSSVNTVRNQLASILRKLQLDSRVELAASGLGSYVVDAD